MSNLILPVGTEGASIPSESLELEPYGGLILVEKVAESDRTLGGIVLPDNESLRVPRWRVIAVGGGYPMQNGVWRVPEVKVGDILMLAPMESGRGQWFGAPSAGNTKRRLVDENCILARVKNDEGTLTISPEASA